jgi:putative transposase
MKKHAKSYRGFRFPGEIIGHDAWLYCRFSLSLGDVEERLAKRGVIITHATSRQWCRKFGPEYARTPSRRQGRPRGFSRSTASSGICSTSDATI